MKDDKAKQRLYLHDILSAIGRIEAYAADGETTFFRDWKTQDAIIRQISIIGEAAGRLPVTMKTKHSDVPWKDIVGMRNIVIHNYVDTDLPTVWETVEQDLPRLKTSVMRMLDAIEEPKRRPRGE